MTEFRPSLEIVRGREIGKSFPIDAGEFVLGNALNGSKGIDLGPQEGESPRKMAGHQALLEVIGKTVALRDLDSPGGTFVNRQRILPGQAKPLNDGDVIQLGGVQLRFANLVPKPIQVNSPLTNHYVTASGSTCRTWDDFLRISSQKWPEIRDELHSGKLDRWLISIGRNDLIVASAPGQSLDEHLDSWLAKLPTTLPSNPELEAHPRRLVVCVTPGGGETTRTIQVANVGFRLLRIQAHVEPANVPWLRVSPEPKTVTDSLELPIRILIPETLIRPLSAKLIIGGNGGSQQIEVILEAKGDGELEATSATISSTRQRSTVRSRIASLRPVQRIAIGLCAIPLRLLVILTGAASEGAESPRLSTVALAMGLIAGLAAASLSVRRGGWKSSLFGAISGSIAGAGAGAIVVALCRGIEPIFGELATTSLGMLILWGLISIGLAGVSMMLIPYQSKSETLS
jgi:hypothetical protein